MDDIKLLIQEYKRKLKTAEHMLENWELSNSKVRVETKVDCYRRLISELENVLKIIETAKVNKLNLLDISNSVGDCKTCGTGDKCDCDNCLDYDRWRPKA